MVYLLGFVWFQVEFECVSFYVVLVDGVMDVISFVQVVGVFISLLVCGECWVVVCVGEFNLGFDLDVIVFNFELEFFGGLESN